MRTNIDIDDKELREAMSLSKAKTKKDTVSLALKQLIRREKMKKLNTYWGSNIWIGDLDKMRAQTK